MKQPRREPIGAVSVAMASEMILAIAIIVAAAIGVNVGAVTHAIADYIGG